MAVGDAGGIVRADRDERGAGAACFPVAAVRSLPAIARRRGPCPRSTTQPRSLEALYAAAVTMGSSSDLVATAEQTLDVVLGVAGSHVGMVYRLDASREHSILIASRGLDARAGRAVARAAGG